MDICTLKMMNLFSISLKVGKLPESSGGRVRNYSQPASSSPWVFKFIYHLGDEQ
jgi:hypothetical protein